MALMAVSWEAARHKKARSSGGDGHRLLALGHRLAGSTTPLAGSALHRPNPPPLDASPTTTCFASPLAAQEKVFILVRAILLEVQASAFEEISPVSLPPLLRTSAPSIPPC
jgi:hypothetical protein